MKLRTLWVALCLAACPGNSPNLALDAPCNPTCGDHESCVRATCVPVDCINALCATGEVCASGQCTSRKCVGIICPGDMTCADGVCYPRPCGGDFCGDDEACIEDRCVAARCVGVACEADQVCANGRCFAPACTSMSCLPGQVCDRNTCTDGSCIGVICPSGQTCHSGTCATGCSETARCSSAEACVAGQCRATAAGLQFFSAPVTVQSAACSAPLTLELVDGAGKRTAAAATTVVTLGASTANTRFFVDDACTVGVNALAFQPTDEVLTFRLRSPVFGSLKLTLSSPNLTPAVQDETVTAAPKELAIASAPQVIVAGACSTALDVQVRDEAGQPAVATEPRVLDLGSTSTTLSWFADAACTVPLAQHVLMAGASGVTLYVRDASAGPQTLSVRSAGLIEATQALTVNAGPPTKLGFATPPREIEAGACSLAVTVRAVDDFGNPSGLTMPASITPFAPSAAQIRFFTDRVCTNEIGPALYTLTLPPGASTATLYMRPLQAGATVLGVSSPGSLAAGSQTESVYASAPTQIAFSTPPQTIGTGQCSSPFTVVVTDQFGNPRDSTQPDTLQLYSSDVASVTLYSNATCTSALGSNVMQGVVAGATGYTFWARSTQPGQVYFYARSALLNDLQQQLTDFSNAAATRLRWVDPVRDAKVGACSNFYALDRLDTFGNPTSPGSPTQVTLSAPGGLQFFSSNDSTCLTPLTSITIPSGQSRGYVRVRPAAAGNVVLTAAAQSVTAGTMTLRALALPDRLTYTNPPRTIVAGACSPQLTVQGQTTTGTPVIPGMSGDIYVGAYYLGVFSDPACNIPVPGSVLALTADGGTSSQSYYVQYTYAGPLTLYANVDFIGPTTGEYLGSASGQQSESIVAATATHLRYSAPPGGANAGGCSGAITAEVRDTYENPVTQAAPRTLGLAVNPAAGVEIFAGPTCSGAAVTTVTVPMGTTGATFSVRSTAAGNKNVDVSSTGLTGETGTLTVYPGPVNALSFTSTTMSVPVNTCSMAVTVTAVDQYGNASSVLSDTPLTLDVMPIGAVSFFTNPTCTTAVTGGNPVKIASGSANTAFHFRPSMTGTVTLRATGGTYMPGTQMESVTP